MANANHVELRLRIHDRPRLGQTANLHCVMHPRRPTFMTPIADRPSNHVFAGDVDIPRSGMHAALSVNPMPRIRTGHELRICVPSLAFSGTDMV